MSRVFCKECGLWTNDLAHPRVPSCPLAPTNAIRARKPTAKRLLKFLEDVRDLAKTEITTERIPCSPGASFTIPKGERVWAGSGDSADVAFGVLELLDALDAELAPKKLRNDRE